MNRSAGWPDDASAERAGGAPASRAARALWCGSAGLVLGVLGTSVLAAGAGTGWRRIVALLLVVAQAWALRWALRIPAAVLGGNAAAGVAVWALLPAVTLTGALLAAQIALCVLAATRSWRASACGLAVMCAPAPFAFAASGPPGLATYLLAVVLAWTAGQWRRAQQARVRAETRRAVVEERARIAREVHDVVAHTLSVMVVQAGAADDAFTDRPEQARQALRAIETGARSALGELRLLLRAFRPDAAETDEAQQAPGPGLARLDELADTVRAAGLAVRVHREDAPVALPAAVDLAAYRIVQEALTNTLRHASGADEVSMRVTADRERVRITVRDNGRAPQARPAPAGSGRGLVGMRERARLLGGSLRAGPAAGGGFEVAAELPVEGAS